MRFVSEDDGGNSEGPSVWISELEFIQLDGPSESNAPATGSAKEAFQAVDGASLNGTTTVRNEWMNEWEIKLK